MKVYKLCFFFLLLSQRSAQEDTVAEDIGVHQVERLVEMLTSRDCEKLLIALSRPAEDIFQRIDRLSLENNRLNSRAKRDADEKSQCRTSLSNWLLKFGEKIYYDRLSRALQHIGRTDIALEVGKNINQDKILNLKRYVEDYKKQVNSLIDLPANPEPQGPKDPHQKGRRIKIEDVSWRDLDLVVKRAPVPTYSKGAQDVALPVLYGILLGLVTCIGLFLILVLVSRE
ncbi:transmembrane and death domain protein 1-like isoform X2 [Gambusia affinis]|uniref:transmembrane and death domain protein 1-like isoform X2 n=1 Tax=Gambusia affinis TaxID=33528 RepID=UPI001CDBD1BC|nr:transmembrane and death domain protein 1-like isoform X2 [Gambusia affinis]